MKVKVQMAMVINLDKCLGCHTCSLTCKNTWTNRPGAEYMWWNNVETKPGIGYPKQWENQDRYRGGWMLKNGKLELRSGSRLARLLRIFHNPDLPAIDDYYEPWTYNYEKLINPPAGPRQPVARPRSLITGKSMEVTWGPNWEDDLAGAHVTGLKDPDMKGIVETIVMDFEKVFMLYLPRICEHCLNPACVASCPSGAVYKREEDGIVLVDQETCRGWRFCISGCPYKKIYFNWQTYKAEKCILCFPRMETGQPTICSETCAGRVRYVGLMLYDADAVKYAASVPDVKELYRSQLNIFLDPNDPEVIRQARLDGIPEDWLEAARKSPVYRMVAEWKIALPLHPEYRTLPMVWYVPPLSPVISASERQKGKREDGSIFDVIDAMRIPMQYLANLLSAGDVEVIVAVLKKMAALRIHMRSLTLGQKPERQVLLENGLDEESAGDMYRLLAIAKYHERFVVPASHREYALDLMRERGTCGLGFCGETGDAG
ncbi:nitrate reductase subunit beta [Desulfofundulus sp.]|uniref:nitrate reductase subunit beta n=1 Tax=Desulfofundulus sp. TaxID=2282750 RepID=UPI003C76B636